AGGVLDQPLHTLHIECPVLSVPDVIRVNIGELQMEQAIYVKQLTVPPGVTVKNDPEAIVVQVRPPLVEEMAPAAAPAAAPCEVDEPEIVGGRVAAPEPEGEPDKKAPEKK